MFVQDANYWLCSMFWCRMVIEFYCINSILSKPQHCYLRNIFQYWPDDQYCWVSFYLFSSCFLATPIDQVKSMFVKARIWFSIAYLGSTIATLVLALTLPANLRYIVLISLIVQIISYFFYTLSYIPFGRKILGKIIKVMAD